VDTTPFRIAIWNYTHRLLGIFHDDYDYELVNIWLLQPLKQYIKKIVCHPYSITDADIIKVGFLLPTEKVHVAFIVMEARREAELISVLRLVTKYTQSNPNNLSNSKSNDDTSSDSIALEKKRKDKFKPDMFFHI
jgi:sestrin